MTTDDTQKTTQTDAEGFFEAVGISLSDQDIQRLMKRSGLSEDEAIELTKSTQQSIRDGWTPYVKGDAARDIKTEADSEVEAEEDESSLQRP